eukprot:Blabericola_migrator_1__305@NODE_107_length_14077_cov_92_419629_g95_i0_p1_GENE_NODE_107_length_14077_cov_92_419629_g95_i0NODE_107_length_14077_cov_92_419629_g95_i0_p1_ORF_typecomplete_len834_score111_06GMC_oxred_N/PF00732_19/4_3e23GMC_oxred_N/PF00732_19/2_9e14GMC_oxred_C/PF05199_13/2_3e20FAD_binding_2/PF00890_24/5_9e09FAD_oxidored/PF12831_7/5_5e07FAD_oxidored/PF12831_7/2_3e03Pyr_redox_2/PF07992_14/6_7e06Pyr_redox_2/PF07992_14/2_1e02Thi4/PF01946_17/5e06Thi4/PF01946_17/7_1e03HI0933_like/PF03486_14
MVIQFWLFAFLSLFACARQSTKQEKTPHRRRLQEHSVASVRSLLNQTFEFSYGSRPKSSFPGPPAFAYDRLTGKNVRRVNGNEEFDFIVIGGGGAGCPAARTLAEAGAKVLLIERGKLRDDSYLTWDLYGVGRAFNDRRIAQPIVTTEGVISHVPNVLGGGTSVNLGFYIEDNKEYFSYLNKHQQFHFDWPTLAQAQLWVRKRIAKPATRRDPYAAAMKENLIKFAKDARYVGPSPQLHVNGIWDGYTVYGNDPTHFRYSADTLLVDEATGRMPSTLTVSVDTTVLKIEFDSSGGTHDAKCVLIRDTTDEDVAPILSRRKAGVGIAQSYSNFMQWLRWFPTVAKVAVKLLGPKSLASDISSIRRVCINDKPGAQIIVSAGAIATPWLLFRSGIGPASELERLDVPTIAEMPGLGRNLTDRFFVPVAYFLEENHVVGKRRHTSQPLAEPAVVQHLLLKVVSDKDVFPTGPAMNANLCSSFNLGDRSKFCSYYAWEEISGGHMAEGSALASRFMFPPRMRGSLVVDLAMLVLSQCSQDASSDLSIFGVHVCPIVQPIIDCFSRAAAHIYLLSEPRSRGWITVGGIDGKSPEITANYLQDSQDILDATRGLASLLQSMSSTNAFDGVLERADSMKTLGEFFNARCPLVVRGNLANLLYTVGDMWSDFIYEEDTIKAENALEEGTMSRFKSILSKMDSPTGQALSEIELENGEMPAWALNASDTESARQLTEFFTRVKNQGYLSFPPVLPTPTNPREVQQFLRRQFTSMWHWHGSAAMGNVVNSDFKLKSKDVSRLAIVDASILGKLPRMNPQATVMHLGRYAGVRLAQEWQAARFP